MSTWTAFETYPRPLPKAFNVSVHKTHVFLYCCFLSFMIFNYIIKMAVTMITAVNRFGNEHTICRRARAQSVARLQGAGDVGQCSTEGIKVVS